MKGVHTFNQLRGRLTTIEIFKESFLKQCPFLIEPKLKRDEDYDDLADLDALVTQIYDYLKRFVDENGFTRSSNVVVSLPEISLDGYIKISQLSDFNLSPDTVEALIRTDKANMGSDLLLQSPFNPLEPHISHRLGNVPVDVIKRILLQKDGDVRLALDYFGFSGDDAALIKSLTKSLVPAITLYSQASLRNSIGLDELPDNLYFYDIKRKKPFVTSQLVSLAEKVCANPSEDYVFGELSKKDRNRVMNVVRGSRGDAKGRLLEHICALFTFPEIQRGLHIEQFDLIDDIRREPYVKSRKKPEDRFLLDPRNLS